MERRLVVEVGHIRLDPAQQLLVRIRDLPLYGVQLLVDERGEHVLGDRERPRGIVASAMVDQQRPTAQLEEVSVRLAAVRDEQIQTQRKCLRALAVEDDAEIVEQEVRRQALEDLAVAAL